VRCGNSDVVVELQLPDFVLLDVVFLATWQSPAISRFLLHSAALAVGCALLADVHGLAAWLHRAFDAGELPYLFQINRITLSNLFEFQFPRRVEGAFEQLAGRGDGG